MTGLSSRALRGTVASLVSILAAASSSQAQEPADLFRVSGSPLSPGLHDHEAIVEARPIEIDGSQLAAGQEKVHFELFGGTRYEAVLSELERRGPADVTWRGWLGPPGKDRVVLTLQGSLVAGMIFSPEGVYEIAPLPDGGHRLAQIDQDRYPECGGALAPPASALQPDQDVVAADPANQIDVMIAYTPQALLAAGGPAAMQTTAQSAVAMANTSFMDSGMVARFVLVATIPATRNDSGDIQADLNWVTSDPGIATSRDVFRADLVSLMVENGAGSCGVGWVMQSPGSGFASHAFQVTARGCAVGNLSYAHEHGHNMGMEHNPENGSPPAQASYPWSFGHWVNGVFRTVMSYANPCTSGCPRVARFSNPNLTYAGLPTGIADQRDNHRTGELTATIVANFRPRALGDFFTLTPCRVLDTRQPGQGPALTSGVPRTITTVGKCGIPSTAAALAFNVTATEATSSGYLALQPGLPTPPATSTINFGAGQTRAKHGVLAIGADGVGTITIQAVQQSPGSTVHVILDVSGYFD